MISARAVGQTTIVSPVTTRVELSQKVWYSSLSERASGIPCKPPWCGKGRILGEAVSGDSPTESRMRGRPSHPVRRAGISRPYYHYAVAMLLGSTLFVTLFRMWDSLSSWVDNRSSFILIAPTSFIDAYVECPKTIKRPFLPYWDKNNTLIFSTGEFIGVYYSEELKYAKRLGYRVIPLSGYLFERRGVKVC
ncbi:hypothetical protein HN51_045443 [Arachis hypogaea]